MELNIDQPQTPAKAIGLSLFLGRISQANGSKVYV
jgi:hypothetical protein